MTAPAHGRAVIDVRRRLMKRFAVLAVVAAAAAVVAGFAVAGGAGAPTSVSLAVSPGHASCSYSESATPKVKCVNLSGVRIKSGTKITLVAKANRPLPAGWTLSIQREGPFATNNDTKRAGRKDSYSAPHLCGPASSASCTAKTTRKVSSTSFDLFRAVVKKADGTSFEADLAIRWCDAATSGCVS
jgi:hypothetical protein